MPRIVAYIKEMLEEDKYGSKYIEKLPIRLKELNAAQLTGMHAHLEKVQKTSTMKLWGNANAEILKRMETELNAKKAVVEAKQKKRYDELLRLRQARAQAKAKKVDGERVVQSILANSKERAQVEVRDEEYKRQVAERIELVKLVVKGEARQKVLIMRGSLFFICAVVAVSAGTKVTYIIASVIIFALIVTGVVFYWAYLATVVTPLIVTEEELQQKIDIRAEDLRLKALNELKRTENEFNARQLREKQERHMIRKAKREAKEAEIVARREEFLSRKSQRMAAASGKGPPVGPPDGPPEVATAASISDSASEAGNSLLSLDISSVAPISESSPAKPQTVVRFAEVATTGGSPVHSHGSLHAPKIATRKSPAELKILRMQSSVVSITFCIEEIKFYSLEFMHELKINLYGFMGLMEHHTKTLRLITDIVYYDDFGEAKNKERDHIDEVSFTALTEFSDNGLHEIQNEYLLNEDFLQPIINKFEKMHAVRRKATAPASTTETSSTGVVTPALQSLVGTVARISAKARSWKEAAVSSSSPAKTDIGSAMGNIATSDNILEVGNVGNANVDVGAAVMSEMDRPQVMENLPPSRDHTSNNNHNNNNDDEENQLEFVKPAFRAANSVKFFHPVAKLAEPDNSIQGWLRDNITRITHYFVPPKVVPSDGVSVVSSKSDSSQSGRNTPSGKSWEESTKRHPRKFVPKPVIVRPSQSSKYGHPHYHPTGMATHHQDHHQDHSHHTTGKLWVVGTSCGGTMNETITLHQHDKLKLSLYAIYKDFRPPHHAVHSVVNDVSVDLTDIISGYQERGTAKKSRVHKEVRNVNLCYSGDVAFSIRITSIAETEIQPSDADPDPPASEQNTDSNAAVDIRVLHGHLDRIKLLRLELFDFQEHCMDPVPNFFNSENISELDLFSLIIFAVFRCKDQAMEITSDEVVLPSVRADRIEHQLFSIPKVDLTFRHSEELLLSKAECSVRVYYRLRDVNPRQSSKQLASSAKLSNAIKLTTTKSDEQRYLLGNFVCCGLDFLRQSPNEVNHDGTIVEIVDNSEHADDKKAKAVQSQAEILYEVEDDHPVGSSPLTTTTPTTPTGIQPSESKSHHSDSNQECVYSGVILNDDMEPVSRIKFHYSIGEFAVDHLDSDNDDTNHNEIEAPIGDVELELGQI